MPDYMVTHKNRKPGKLFPEDGKMLFGEEFNVAILELRNPLYVKSEREIYNLEDYPGFYLGEYMYRHGLLDETYIDEGEEEIPMVGDSAKEYWGDDEVSRYESILVDILEKAGYDAVVFLVNGEAYNILFFGSNSEVKWLDKGIDITKDVFPVIRYGEAGNSKMYSGANGIFFTIAEGRNVFDSMNRLSTPWGIRNVVPIEDGEDEAPEDYLHYISRKLDDDEDTTKASKKYHYGIVECDKPFYDEMITHPNGALETLAVPGALMHLRGQRDIGYREVVDFLSESPGKSPYDSLTRKLIREAREKGYDSVVWYLQGKPTELLFFGDYNNIKWYD